MFGCLGLGCMGELTTDQRTKATAMLGALRNYLTRLQALQKVGFDSSSAVTNVSISITGLEGAVAAGDWDMAVLTYKGAVFTAENTIAQAEKQYAYSQPNAASPAPFGPITEGAYMRTDISSPAAQIGTDALQSSVAVAQQSSAVQAATTPFLPSDQDWDSLVLHRAPSDTVPKKSNTTTYVIIGAVALGFVALYLLSKRGGTHGTALDELPSRGV